MNILHTGLLAAGIAATASVAGTQLGDGPSSEPPGTLAEEIRRYKVLVTGGDTGCDIAPGGVAGPGRAELVLGGRCAAAPGFQDLSYWLERGDGSIALAGPDGEIRFSFAAADGAAYESYGPGVPLMALIAVKE